LFIAVETVSRPLLNAGGVIVGVVMLAQGWIEVAV